MRPLSLTHDPHDRTAARRLPHAHDPSGRTPTSRHYNTKTNNIILDARIRYPVLKHPTNPTPPKRTHPKPPPHPPHPPGPATPCATHTRRRDETKDSKRYAARVRTRLRDNQTPGRPPQRTPGAGPVLSGPNSAPPHHPPPRRPSGQAGPRPGRSHPGDTTRTRNRGHGTFTTFPPMSTHPVARTATRG